MNSDELTIEEKLEFQRLEMQRKKNAEYSRNYRLRRKENQVLIIPLTYKL
jgi:hypothetical protein